MRAVRNVVGSVRVWRGLAVGLRLKKRACTDCSFHHSAHHTLIRPPPPAPLLLTRSQSHPNHRPLSLSQRLLPCLARRGSNTSARQNAVTLQSRSQPRLTVRDGARPSHHCPSISALSSLVCSMPQLRAYIAGPEVFLPNAVELSERKKAICADLGFEASVPLDQDMHSGTHINSDGLASAIFQKDMAMMQSSDFFIANLTPFGGVSADAGTFSGARLLLRCRQAYLRLLKRFHYLLYSVQPFLGFEPADAGRDQHRGLRPHRQPDDLLRSVTRWRGTNCHSHTAQYWPQSGCIGDVPGVRRAAVGSPAFARLSATTPCRLR